MDSAPLCYHLTMSIGNEWLVDAEGCPAERLSDIETIRRVCEEIIADLDLRVIGAGIWHKFPSPGGVTGLFLLTESHLACHTYPETGIATFNLYCCRPRPAWSWENNLTERLGARRVGVTRIVRGAAPATLLDSRIESPPTNSILEVRTP